MAENQQSKPSHTYVMDPENPAEMARLMLIDRMITEAMQGVFSEQSNVDTIQAILDVGCGPGGWALDVARIYPDTSVVGIDISTTMVTYAQAQATAQRLSNVTFLVMNALLPLNFTEATFDLVNVRFATGYVPRVQWLPFLEHCFHVLRPGGILRLTEADTTGLSNSLACEKMTSWVTRMLHTKGYGFSPDGSHFGVMPMMGLLLRQVGCVNIRSKPYMLDYSTGTAFHNSQYQNCMVAFALMKSAFIQEGLTTEEGFDQAYQQMLDDLQLPDFRGLDSILTVWGEKPRLV